MNNKHKLTTEILSVLNDLGGLLPKPFETPYSYIKRTSGVPRYKYNRAVSDLQKRNCLKIAKHNGKKFLRLTSKGEMELLLAKARSISIGKWDGKWRLIMFDIPEYARQKRDQLRRLLKSNYFMKIQASVFISPFVLNQSAINYLKRTGLINYIRIMRVDQLDEDKVLKRYFKL